MSFWEGDIAKWTYCPELEIETETERATGECKER
jgi:hypothetical protein